MIVKIKNINHELKFTFNSFKYMKDFNVKDLTTLESQPFKIISVTEELLIGALNNNPKVRVYEEDIEEYLEQTLEDGTLMELLETLIQLLEESSFFKALQKKETK